MAVGAREIEKLLVRIVGDASGYVSALRRAETATRAAAEKIERLGRRMTAAISAPLALAGGLGVKEFARFDQALTETFAKMGRVTPEVRKQLEGVAKALATSGQVMFSPAELAKGYEELAGVGLDAARAMEALPIAARLAQAGAFDMETAVKSLVGSMASFRQMGKTPEEFARNMVRFSDVVVNIANQVQGDVRQMAIAMGGDAANSARQYGMTLEELGSVIAVFAKQNIFAEEASNLVGRGIRLLTSAYTKHKEVWQRMNIEITDGRGNFLRYADAIEKLDKALRHLPAEQRVMALEELGFETLAQKAILPLIGLSDQLRVYEKSLKEAGGATQTMAEIQMESFANQMKVVRNQLLVVAIEAGEVLAPVMRRLGEAVSDAANWFRNLNPLFKQLTVFAGVAVAVLGPLLIVAGLLGPVLIRGVLVALVPLKALGLAFRMVGAAAAVAVRLLGTGLWLAWTGAVSVAKGALLLFKLSMIAVTGVIAAFQFAVVAATAVVRLLTLGMVAARVATLLSAAAVTAWGIAVGVVSGVVRGATMALLAAEIAIRTIGLTTFIARAALLAFGAAYAIVAKSIFLITRAYIVYNAAVKASIVALGAAFLVVKTFFATLKIQQVISAALWAVWALKVAVATVAVNIWGAAILVAKGAVWLLNAALTVMNALVAPATLIAVAVTIGVVGAAFVVVGAAIYAAWEAGKALFQTLGKLPGLAAGPLSQIGAMFGEWVEIIKEVVSVAETDLPMAWKLLQAGATLAVAQLRDLFPPLWRFIQDGFSAVWELVKGVFVASFKEGVAEAGKAILGLADTPLFKILFPTASLFTGPFKKSLDEMSKAAGEARQKAVEDAEKALEAAAARFEIPEGQAAKQARKALEAVRNEIKLIQAQKWGEELIFGKAGAAGLGKAMADVRDNAEGAGLAMMDKVAGGAREAATQIQRLDAVLTRSAEAASRVAAYTDAIRSQRGVGLAAGATWPRVQPMAAQQPRIPVGPAVGAVAGGAVEALLRDIRDGIRQQNKKPGVNLQGAGLGG